MPGSFRIPGITATIHPYGWGTILVGGMRFGGPNIAVRDVFGTVSTAAAHTFKPAYFAIDITWRREPPIRSLLQLRDGL
jgi:hypothetical protein